MSSKQNFFEFSLDITNITKKSIVSIDEIDFLQHEMIFSKK